MAKVTIGFGVALIALGIWGYVATGNAHPTALIPTWFGLALVVCGALATSEKPGWRAAWMHVAVCAGLLGFIGALVRVIIELVGAHGGPLAHPVAVEDQAAMAVVCLVFVALCVRSFMAAKRGRVAAS